MSIVRDRNRRGKRRTDNKIDVVCHRICHYAVADVRQRVMESVSQTYVFTKRTDRYRFSHR